MIHHPPFRLLDRVVKADLTRGQLLATRTLTSGDALWPAESAALGPISPENARFLTNFPDVLLIEALAQAAACLNALELAKQSPALKDAATGDHLGYLVAVSDFRFPNFADRACIGETLYLSVQRQSSLGALVAFAASVEAGDAEKARPLASGRLLFSIQPK